MLPMTQFASSRANRSTRADLQDRGMVPWSELGGGESTCGAALTGMTDIPNPKRAGGRT